MRMVVITGPPEAQFKVPPVLPSRWEDSGCCFLLPHGAGEDEQGGDPNLASLAGLTHHQLSQGLSWFETPRNWAFMGCWSVPGLESPELVGTGGGRTLWVAPDSVLSPLRRHKAGFTGS